MKKPGSVSLDEETWGEIERIAMSKGSTKSEVVEAHKDMPIIILDDWSEFKKIKFTKTLYKKIWNNFNIGDLHMDNYLKRIKQQIPQ